MTEEEAKKALFDLHHWYMTHSPLEREKIYDEYQQKRTIIKHELTRYIMESQQEKNTEKKK